MLDANRLGNKLDSAGAESWSTTFRSQLQYTFLTSYESAWGKKNIENYVFVTASLSKLYLLSSRYL